nr:unnamed protein product [Callosobruchus chinensis]
MVEVKTGEEDEDVLFCQRAKLFRFVGDEWKERGLGDIKILRNKATGKLRVVMRRDQVLKICLNHVLTKDIEYLPKDEKSWLFHAADFSEGEIAREQFCVRFKTPEVADEFKKAVTDALDGCELGKNTPKVATSSKDDGSDDEIQITFETKVTPEEEKEAIRLGLPPKFLSYRQLPDCTCEQCKKDDEYFKNAQNASLVMTPKGTKSVYWSTSSTPPSTNTPSQVGSVFGTPENSSFTKSPQQGGDSQRNLLLKPPVFAAPKEAGDSTVPKTEPSAAKFTFSFGQTTTPSTPKGIFSSASTTTSGGSIFGNKPTSESVSSSPANLFGTTTNNTSATAGNLFGKPVNIFGGAVPSTDSAATKSTTATTAGSLFATTTTTGFFSSPANIFSNASINTPSSTTKSTTTTTTANTFSSNMSIFGGNSTPSVISGSTASTPLFGSTTPTFGGSGGTTLFGSGKNSIFGGGTAANTASATPVFGGATTPVFGANSLSTAATTTSPSTPTTTPSIFGNATKTSTVNLSFGDMVPKEGKTTNLKEGDEAFLKGDSDFSFAALAAQTTSDAQPAFAKTDGTKSFAFLGAGAPVFGSKTPMVEEAGKSKGGGSGDEATWNAEASTDENYDPYYEPIVPLPDEIVVSTGEEEEVAAFNERAKLYRFDASTDQWKERGVGQFKVLHHPVNGTYRLLLRREQVHKIVLNQLITPSLELKPMHTSDKSWMWAGYNYVENENNFEQLAVKFKTTELAERFYKIIQDVISKCNKSSVLEYSTEDPSEDPLASKENTEEYEDEEYDEDDRSVMFVKQCTFSEQLPDNTWQEVCSGELQVYYDPELYAAKISVNDENGEVMSNTLIGLNTLMDVSIITAANDYIQGI